MAIEKLRNESHILRVTEHSNRFFTRKPAGVVTLLLAAVYSIALLFSQNRLISATQNSKSQTQVRKKNFLWSANSDPSLSESVKKLEAANGATGTIFSGIPIRRYSGSWEFATKSEEAVHRKARSSSSQNSSFPIMGRHCPQWAVVTTINPPTPSILEVAKLTHWCTVVVADTKTPRDYRRLAGLENQENFVFLSIEDQKKIMDPFVSKTPFKSFARKNIGYLYAIRHGAKLIYDFDDDNFIKSQSGVLFNQDDLFSFLQSPQVDVDVALVTTTAFNPFQLMGSSNEGAWPRGFPLNLIKNQATLGSIAYTKKAFTSKEIGVLQFCIDKDPDLDAIQRLSQPLPMTYAGLKSKSSALIVPSTIFVPYNAQATIHSLQTFWALLLPATVPGRVSDIWRAYFAEHFFRELGIHVSYLPPDIVQERNEHDYLADFQAELDLYLKANRLLAFLKSWQGSAPHLPGRIEQLWVELFERGYIELEDVKFMQLWIDSLLAMGYDFPKLQLTPVRFHNVVLMGQFNYPSSVKNVLFWVQKWRTVFDKVVVFMPLDKMSEVELSENQISAINYTADRGVYSPVGNLLQVVQQYRNDSSVDGVLYIHDDLLINMAELLNLISAENRTELFPSHALIASRFSDAIDSLAVAFPNGSFAVSEWFDGGPKYYDNISEFLGMLNSSKYRWPWWDRTVPGLSKIARDPRSAKFHQNGGIVLGHSLSDVLYVPMRNAEDFIDASQLAFENKVMLEGAFPWILRSLQMHGAKRIEASLCNINSNYLRFRPSLYFQKCKELPEINTIYHPIKLSVGMAVWAKMFDEFTWGTK